MAAAHARRAPTAVTAAAGALFPARAVGRTRKAASTAWTAARLLLALGTLVTCGYRPISLAHPFGARAVAVLPFVELPPVGVNDELAARLGDGLRAGGAHVVTDVSCADALLEGELRVSNRPGTTLQAVQVYHVDGVVEARWRDAAGAVAWRGRATATESYLPQGVPGVRQPAATETQRRMALQRLAERLAQQLAREMDAAQLPAARASASARAPGPEPELESGLDPGPEAGPGPEPEPAPATPADVTSPPVS